MKTASMPATKPKRRVPMLDLKRQYEYLRKEIDGAIRQCLDHQKWILGPEVGEFEKAVASYLGVKHSIGVSSGTDALVLALQAMSIRKTGRECFPPGTRIITSSFTFTATGDAILRAGAVPVFIDIDPVTLTMQPDRLRKYLDGLSAEDLQSCAGILPVHLFGQSADMASILETAAQYGLFVLEDAAQSLGSAYDGRKTGSLGDVSATSFFPSKNLGGFGDGGLVATDNDEIEKLVRMLLKHGGESKYRAEYLGYNARLDTIQAAVLKAKLPYLDEFNKRRQQRAERYIDNLRDIDGLQLPRFRDGKLEHVFNQFTVRVRDGKRDVLAAALADRGIQSQIYYAKALHQMPLFSNRSLSPAPMHETENACLEVLSLPLDPFMEDEDINYVISAVREIMTSSEKVGV